MLTRQAEDEAITRAIDWTQYDTLKAQGLADREIARRWDIPWSTFHREKQRREGADLTSPEVVVHLACHECFERRDYLPQHATEEGEP